MKISILDTCTGCGACEAICPSVFSVDKKAHVNNKKVKSHEQDCIDAALVCPVNAIWIEDI